MSTIYERKIGALQHWSGNVAQSLVGKATFSRTLFCCLPPAADARGKSSSEGLSWKQEEKEEILQGLIMLSTRQTWTDHWWRRRTAHGVIFPQIYDTKCWRQSIFSCQTISWFQGQHVLIFEGPQIHVDIFQYDHNSQHLNPLVSGLI